MSCQAKKSHKSFICKELYICSDKNTFDVGINTINTPPKLDQYIRWQLWYNSIVNPVQSGERNWNYSTTSAFRKGLIEAIKGEKTINEIASLFEIHPNQVRFTALAGAVLRESAGTEIIGTASTLCQGKIGLDNG